MTFKKGQHVKVNRLLAILRYNKMEWDLFKSNEGIIMEVTPLKFGCIYMVAPSFDKTIAIPFFADELIGD
jgi:hypothetical protein